VPYLLGMKRGFLVRRGWGGRGVKEKQLSLANDAAKDTVVISLPVVDEPVVAAGNTTDNPDVNLLKEDVGNVLVLVKLHGVHVMAFSEDCLIAIDTKLGTTLMLDSYTFDMCMQSWGMSSYARVMIELRADVKLKDTIMVDECFKRIGSDVAKDLKNPTQAPRGVLVGPNVGFKPAKQVYRHVSKKNNANTSGNKKKDAKSRKEVSTPNPVDVLNSVKNDIDLGTNGETLNLASKKANFGGFSFWNVVSISTSTTPIIGNIDKLKRLIIDGKLTLVDNKGKRLENIDYPGDHDSDDEVKLVDNEMTSFLASKMVGYGKNRAFPAVKNENQFNDYGNNDDFRNTNARSDDIVTTLPNSTICEQFKWETYVYYSYCIDADTRADLTKHLSLDSLTAANAFLEVIRSCFICKHSKLSSYARAMVELHADVELKDTLLVVVPKFMGEGYTLSIIRVEYEWTPPRRSRYNVFGHVMDECPKKLVLDVLKNLKKPSQAVKRVHVGSNVGSKV
nr:hypothetical protein [Tanacetum cinerariifolium]